MQLGIFFLFQQLYFWLIDVVNYDFGFSYISFPICFTGGIVFYTVQKLITVAIKRVKCSYKLESANCNDKIIGEDKND